MDMRKLAKDFEAKKVEGYKELLEKEQRELQEARIVKRESDIERAMKQADASLRIEGLFVSEEDIELIRMKLRGEISDEEFLKQAVELAKKA